MNQPLNRAQRRAAEAQSPVSAPAPQPANGAQPAMDPDVLLALVNSGNEARQALEIKVANLQVGLRRLAEENVALRTQIGLLEGQAEATAGTIEGSEADGPETPQTVN